MEDLSELDAAELVSDPRASYGYYEFRQLEVDAVFARLRAARTVADGLG